MRKKPKQVLWTSNLSNPLIIEVRDHQLISGFAGGKMKHRILAVFMALACVALVAPAFAQNTVIKGYIKGTDGKPMPDVQVDFKNTSSGQQIHLKTDKK